MLVYTEVQEEKKKKQEIQQLILSCCTHHWYRQFSLSICWKLDCFSNLKSGTYKSKALLCLCESRVRPEQDALIKVSHRLVHLIQ